MTTPSNPTRESIQKTITSEIGAMNDLNNLISLENELNILNSKENRANAYFWKNSYEQIQEKLPKTAKVIEPVINNANQRIFDSDKPIIYKEESLKIDKRIISLEKELDSKKQELTPIETDLQKKLETIDPKISEEIIKKEQKRQFQIALEIEKLKKVEKDLTEARQEKNPNEGLIKELELDLARAKSKIEIRENKKENPPQEIPEEINATIKNVATKKAAIEQLENEFTDNKKWKQWEEVSAEANAREENQISRNTVTDLLSAIKERKELLIANSKKIKNKQITPLTHPKKSDKIEEKREERLGFSSRFLSFQKGVSPVDENGKVIGNLRKPKGNQVTPVITLSSVYKKKGPGR